MNHKHLCVSQTRIFRLKQKQKQINYMGRKWPMGREFELPYIQPAFTLDLYSFNLNQHSCLTIQYVCCSGIRWYDMMVIWFMMFSTQVSHLFDNEGTVAFAMFMAIWGEYLIWANLMYGESVIYWDLGYLFMWLSVFSHPVPWALEETQSHTCFTVEGVWLVWRRGTTKEHIYCIWCIIFYCKATVLYIWCSAALY